MADPKNLKQYVIDGKKYKIDARYKGDSLKNVIAKIRAKNAATAGEPSGPSGYDMTPLKSDKMVPRNLNIYHKSMNTIADILSGGAVKPYPEKRSLAEVEYDETGPIRAAAEVIPQMGSDILSAGSAAIGTGLDYLGYGPKDIKMGQVDVPFSERMARSGFRYDKYVDVPQKSKDYYKKFSENLAALPGTSQTQALNKAGKIRQLNKDIKYFQDPKTVQAIQNIKKNKPTEKIFKEANKEGYVVAPSQTSNPTKMQQRAESAVGQSKMIEAVNIKNQEVTDRLVRKYLGLKEDAPLDSLIMDQVRAKHGKVYQTIEKLKGKTDTKVTGSGGLTNPKKVQTTVIHRNGDEILDDLKNMQAEERGLWRQYNFGEKAGDNSLRLKAVEAGKTVEKLEEELVKLISYNKQPNLYKKYQKARKDIAKTYTIESAMNPQTGMVDARKLGNKLGTKKGHMTGEAKKIASFARANPNAAKAPKSRVAKEFELGDLAYSAHHLLQMKPIRALAPIARPMAKRHLLNPKVQNKIMTQQNNVMPKRSLLDSNKFPGVGNIAPFSLLEMYKDKYK